MQSQFSHLFLTLTLCIGICFVNEPLQAQSFEDMVFIPAFNGDSGFYIDIFETTNKLGAEAGLIGDWDTQNYKPARFELEEAKQYCGTVGKRLPTLSEWLRAASLNGTNRDYSLRGDTLSNYVSSREVNFGNRSGSIDPYSFTEMGIDVAGTVGMTGNRPEWVYDQANSQYCKCGRGYRDNDEDEARLSNTCDCPGSGNGTTRCVSDSASANVTLTSKVSGDLLSYINSIASGGAPTGGSTGPGPVGSPTQKNGNGNSIAYDQLDIDDDESDFDY